MSNDANKNLVVRRYEFRVAHPLVTAACFTMCVTAIGSVVVNCIATRYGRQPVSTKRKTTKKSSK